MQYFADIYLEYDLCLRRFGDLDLLRLRSEKKNNQSKKEIQGNKGRSTYNCQMFHFSHLSTLYSKPGKDIVLVTRMTI